MPGRKHSKHQGRTSLSVPHLNDGHAGSSNHSHAPSLPVGLLDLELAVARTDVITRLVAGLTGRTQSPWLVIVIRFSDDLPIASILPGGDRIRRYKRVFTADGQGELNMVDYFLDMTHGLLDLSNSAVVGPYRLSRPRADYVGNVYPQPAGRLNRNGILDLAKATAVAKGVDLAKYAGVVVCGTPTLDLCGWLGGMAALCGDDALQPSLLGQELGHGYGADHSGRDGSTDEYADQWDTMSTASAHSAPHDEFGSIGPGLNAWNMRLRGWLDENRVVTVKPGSRAVVTLKPLHDRPFGTIAIDVHGFLVEFRLRARWDAGIPRSCVLVHRVEGNRSYLMASTVANNDLGQGDRFEWGSPVSGTHIVVEVLEIDEADRSARVGVQYSKTRIPEFEPNRYLGGVDVGGGGFRITPRGLEPVPPREPVSRLLQMVERYDSALQVASSYGNPALQLEALADIAEEIGRIARRVEVTSFHPSLSFSTDLGPPLEPSHEQHVHHPRGPEHEAGDVRPKKAPAKKRKTPAQASKKRR